MGLTFLKLAFGCQSRSPGCFFTCTGAIFAISEEIAGLLSTFKVVVAGALSSFFFRLISSLGGGLLLGFPAAAAAVAVFTEEESLLRLGIIGLSFSLPFSGVELLFFN